MKVYFSTSRFYKQKNIENYKSVIEVLEGDGFDVLDGSSTRLCEMGFKMPVKEMNDLYRSVVKMMDKSELCVFEASYPSTLHIGHEITLALEKNKPVIGLHAVGREPILFKGMKNGKIRWVEYNSKNLKDLLLEAINEAKKDIDVRFNFFVSPEILAYLDWVSQNKMIPRSVFLRNLIEKEMKKDKEFKG
ncbi:hypothetical protein KKD37_03500 [Patescibacteria group bacterium]|nr:hypothetical protein [Patescibacteria group bacterium]